MSESARLIEEAQDRWAGNRPRDARWDKYLRTVEENLFLRCLLPESRIEFRDGDGSELHDTPRRPAKMRALVSSSALAVNFFDAWRDADKGQLAAALGLSAPIVKMQFEFKPKHYPIRPRSPNLDLFLGLENGQGVGIESKFSEPFRSDDGHGVLSTRYFSASKQFWAAASLEGAQAIADRLRPEWIHLDAAQLLKHLLGLAHAPEKPNLLLYMWFDTGRPDSEAHRREIERFAGAVMGGAVAFRAIAYQAVFHELARTPPPKEGWDEYMATRYFSSDGSSQQIR